MSEVLNITEFDGLVTSVGVPPPNSARAVQNLVRHKKRGILQSAGGYTQKFTLPANDTTLRKISNIDVVDFHSFCVPEHGGKDIWVAVATYRKTAFFPGNPTTDTFGIWVRPYWDGSAWIDQWRELTEFMVFELRQKLDDKLFIDDAVRNYNFAALDPGLTMFNSVYFSGWSIVLGNGFSESNDAENYLLVTGGSGFSGSYFYFTFFGNVAQLPTRNVGDKLSVYRAFVNKALPASLSSHIHSLFSEIRLTSGNNTTDVGLMAGFRLKTFGWLTSDKDVDRLLSDVSVPDVWRNAFMHDTPTVSQSSDPLPNKTFYLKETLVFDDGQETELRNVLGGVAATAEAVAAITSIALDSNYAKAIVYDGTYIYAGTGASPAKIYKIDPNSMMVIASLALSGNDCRALVLNIGYLFAGLGTSPGRIIAIDTFSMTEVNSLTLSDNICNALINSGGQFLYAALGSTIAKVDKVALFPFSLDSTTVLTGLSSANSLVESPYPDPRMILVGCNGGRVGWFSPDDPSSFGSVALSSGTLFNVFAMIVSGTSAYVGTGNGAVKARICKLDMSTPPLEIGSFYELSTTGNNDCRALLHDGSHLYVGLNTSPLKVAKLDVATWPPTGDLFTLTAIVGFNFAASLLDYGTSFFVAANMVSGKVLRINKTPQNPITRGEKSQIDFKLLVSAGATPRKAKKVRFYLSEDNKIYYKVKEVGLLAGELVWEEAAYFHATTKHHYHKSATISIKGSDWNDGGGAEASVNIGRGISDTGVIRYKHAAVVGSKTFATGIRIGNELFANKVASSTSHGDGINQYDVFPNNGIRLLDVEYNDGDEARAVIGVAERILVLKRRSVVLLTPNNRGGFDRDVITKEDGISSVKTLVVFRDEAFWCGYFGWYRFSTRGLQPVNAHISLDWLALTTVQKEAALGVVDVENRIWIVSAGGKQWHYDFGRYYAMGGVPQYVDEGKVMGGLFSEAPLALKQSVDGAVEFLSDGLLPDIPPGIVRLTDKVLHGGRAFDLFYETNRIEVPLKARQDGLLTWFYFRYKSGVNITVKIFRGDDITAWQSFVLSAANVETRIRARLSSRCKAFRMRFEATIVATAQSVEILSVEAYYEPIPTGISRAMVTA